MPAQSRAQQGFMGLVLALKTGEIAANQVSQEVRDAAADMTLDEAKEMATGKHKDLPEHASPPEGNSQGQKTAGLTGLGKAELAFGKFVSKALGKLPSLKATTHADDVIGATRRMGPFEAGLMSGKGVNRVIASPANKARVLEHLDDVPLVAPGKAHDFLPASAIKKYTKDQTTKSKKIHEKLYTKGDVNADLPVGVEISKVDKALYATGKYGPTAGVAGYAAHKVSSPSPNAEIATGWDGGDWTKYSTGNHILDK